MRKVGNVASNQIYNSENRKPPVPVDADEADSAMERFIRQKYTNNTVNNGTKMSRPRSDEGVPPPLPPKNSKFGFRSATSIFPLSSRARKEAKLASAQAEPTRQTASRDSNRGDKGFGVSVDYEDGDDMERKLANLQDMGFNDRQRNAIVLKGVNGNLERAIESLVRLGEGGSRSPAPPPLPKDNVLRPSKSMTPLNSSSTGGQPLGLSLTPKTPATPSSTSTNPFDMMGPAPPQTAQSTGTLQNKNPYNQSGQTLNPYGVPQNQHLDAFSQSFQQLSVSTAQQPQQLFPHHTGGLTPQPQSQPMWPPQVVPSAPSSPQMHQGMGFQNMTYPQPQQQQLQQQQTGYNPFFTGQNNVQQQAAQANLSINTQGAYGNNPFARSPTAVASPASLGQIPEASQTSYQNMAFAPHQQQQQNMATNPFFASPVQTPTQMGYQQQHQQGYGQQTYFQPQRHDKASIMALYGSSQPVAPQATSPTASAQPSQITSIPEDPSVQMQMTPQSPGQAQRGMTAPGPPSSSKNPFMMNNTQQTGTDPFSTQRQVSRESMTLGMEMAWNNGRHSPDAFASLSSRHA